MYYSRQDYNLLMCLANAKRVGTEHPYGYLPNCPTGDFERVAQQYLSGVGDFERVAQQYLASAAELERLAQVQRPSLQDLMNQQFLSFENQIRNRHYNPSFRQGTSQNDSREIVMKRNQTVLELEKLKMLLGGLEESGNGKNNWMLSAQNAGSATQLLQKGNAQPNLTMGARFPVPCETYLPGLDDDAAKLPGLRPDTPSSDVFSDVSSGLGTMPSPVSDLESAPELLPPRPTTESIFHSEDYNEPEKVIEEEPAVSPPKDNIQYQGRNILDLYTNMTYQWSFQMAVLPQHNLVTHFQYRSLYHRLGPYGMIEELGREKCRFCDFDFVVPK